jgi:hypothetical protein
LDDVVRGEHMPALAVSLEMCSEARIGKKRGWIEMKAVLFPERVEEMERDERESRFFRSS